MIQLDLDKLQCAPLYFGHDSERTHLDTGARIMPEVTHIAVVQTAGLTDAPRGATRSRAFATLNSALEWVRDVVDEAHGSTSVLDEYAVADQYDLRAPTWHITSLDGPVHGWVIETQK